MSRVQANMQPSESNLYTLPDAVAASAANPTPPAKPQRARVSTTLASVKLTIFTMALIAATVLVGAWCPQESQAGREKIVEQFGEANANLLIQFGIADVFHSPFFLSLIGLLTLNMVACSFQRVFPKIRALKQQMPCVGLRAIAKFPLNYTVSCRTSSPNLPDGQSSLVSTVVQKLRKQGFSVRQEGDRIAAESGKYGKLAATVTHIGLLTLLLGVTITSWTGFSGFKPVRLGDKLTFMNSEHSKLWVGKLPQWSVRVDDTRREDYPSGEAKQWYSDLTVIDPDGKTLAKQQISVNTPLSFQGVDVYQSSWGIDQIVVSFNGTPRKLQLRPMGKRYAAFLPLDEETIFIFSVKNKQEPLRLFAKRKEWEAPKLIVELMPGQSKMLGTVMLRYDDLIPVTGLQYKSDPGLPLTYIAFAFIMVGVMMAAIPHRLVWVAVEAAGETSILAIGGRSAKSKVGFERWMQKFVAAIETEFGTASSSAESQTATTSSDTKTLGETTKGNGGSEQKSLVATQSNSEVKS